MDRRTFTTLLGTSLAGVAGAGCQSTPKRAEPVRLDKEPPQPTEGTLFEYDHTGPRPFGDGVDDITGIRWFGVYQRESNLWRIDEAFKRLPEVRSFYIDDGFALHREHLYGATELIIDYAPPRELRYLGLTKDESLTATFQHTYLQPPNQQPLGTATVTDSTTRRYDERIVTPLGAYLCRSFDTELEYVMTVGESMLTYSVRIRTYWSDEYAWFLSEEADFSPVLRDRQRIRDGYKTKSDLVKIEQFSS